MCSLFGLIDFKECLSTHTKNKILNTLARKCQVRGTDATGMTEPGSMTETTEPMTKESGRVRSHVNGNF